MIKSFANRQTWNLFTGKNTSRFPPEIAKRAVRKLDSLNYAVSLHDLVVPPGNRLHALSGNRAGQYSISINDQYRICFRFADGDAFDVEVCDYHG